jgi:hypothetical protein
VDDRERDAAIWRRQVNPFIWLVIVGLLLWLGQGCATRPTKVPPSPSMPPEASVPEPPVPVPPAPVPPKPAPGVARQPNWAISGSGAFISDRGRVFNAVGQAGGISHRSLLRAAADNKARAEMTSVLKSYMAVLVQKTQPHGMDAQTEQAVNALTAELLKNAIIKEHYTDAAQGRLFSLCTIDLKTVKRVISSASQLEGRTRQRLVRSADQVHGLRMQATR